MDWNKSYNVLIIAFLILNIVLLGFIYFSQNVDLRNYLKEKEEFLINVKLILEQKNISLATNIPNEIYEAPFLELEYSIIQPNRELVENYLGKFNGPVNNETLIYRNEFESFEIEGIKKINYINFGLEQLEVPRENLDVPLLSSDEAQRIINDFCTEKNIDLTGFVKVCDYDEDNYRRIKFVEQYEGYNLENSYLEFYIMKGKVYTFSMQKVSSVSERAIIKSLSAAETLLRLMTFDDIKDKEIKDLQICYYTQEDEDFKNKNSISTDLVWKTIFSDNTFVYLVSDDENN